MEAGHSKLVVDDIDSGFLPPLPSFHLEYVSSGKSVEEILE